jgi:hypothetical protein
VSGYADNASDLGFFSLLSSDPDFDSGIWPGSRIHEQKGVYPGAEMVGTGALGGCFQWA